MGMSQIISVLLSFSWQNRKHLGYGCLGSACGYAHQGLLCGLARSPCLGGPGEVGGFPDGSVVKESACQCRRHRRFGFHLWVRKILWRRKGQPASLTLPGESHGPRSLVAIVLRSQTQLSEHTHRGERDLTSKNLGLLACLFGCLFHHHS